MPKTIANTTGTLLRTAKRQKTGERMPQNNKHGNEADNTKLTNIVHSKLIVEWMLTSKLELHEVYYLYLINNVSTTNGFIIITNTECSAHSCILDGVPLNGRTLALVLTDKMVDTYTMPQTWLCTKHISNYPREFNEQFARLENKCGVYNKYIAIQTSIPLVFATTYLNNFYNKLVDRIPVYKDRCEWIDGVFDCPLKFTQSMLQTASMACSWFQINPSRSVTKAEFQRHKKSSGLAFNSQFERALVVIFVIDAHDGPLTPKLAAKRNQLNQSIF